MPRPRPLENGTSRRPLDWSSNQALTPRTPHSRAGRAEEALHDIPLDTVDEDYATYRQQQAEPLLASSASDAFPPTGYRSSGDEYDSDTSSASRLSLELIVSRLPLAIGCLVAFLLLFLTVLSARRPDFLQHYIGETPAPSSAPHFSNEGDTAASLGSELPSAPAHISISDPNLISYENYTKFPLHPMEYRAECVKLNGPGVRHGAYWDIPFNGPYDVPHYSNGDNIGSGNTGSGKTMCESTITYMLDGHVGLLADLALMAQGAALARERNKTFFIDDTYWNRGKWTDHFDDVHIWQPGPQPGCLPPPPEELVACPRTARHWIINSRTAIFHYNHDAFGDAYQDAYAIGLNRMKPIFQQALESLEGTVRPNSRNAYLIREARKELSTLNAPSYLSTHIRRGDRTAVSWTYHGKHLPTEKYSEAVQDTHLRLNSNNIQHPLGVVYAASDSPIAIQDLIGALPSNYSVFSLSTSQNPALNAVASPKEYIQQDFNTLPEADRIDLTRGVIVDFALLSGMWAWDHDAKPYAVVCTISSNICKLSALGLGWDVAFGHLEANGMIDEQNKGWVEIDNRDTVVPVWKAFEIFR